MRPNQFLKKPKTDSMADFCQQCSEEIFDQDFKELAGITPFDAWNDDKASVVLCEGCGPIQVDPEGRCVSSDCLKKHSQSEEDNFE